MIMNGAIQFTLYEASPTNGDSITFTTYASDPLTCSATAGSDDDGDLQVAAGHWISATYTTGGVDYKDWAQIYGPGEPVVVTARNPPVVASPDRLR